MSFKSSRAASIAASRERTNCQYVLLMSLQTYSMKYVVLVRLAVSIVVITLFVFWSPEPAGSVGLLPQPGYKDRYYFLITKNFSIIFYNLFRNTKNRAFGLGVVIWDYRTTIQATPLFFPNFRFTGLLAAGWSRWPTFAGNAAKSPGISQNRHKRNTAATNARRIEIRAPVNCAVVILFVIIGTEHRDNLYCLLHILMGLWPGFPRAGVNIRILHGRHKATDTLNNGQAGKRFQRPFVC